MKRAYTIWVCPRCGESYMFAGSCIDDNERLVSARVIPVNVVQEFRDMYSKNASPVPRWFIEHFVKGLVEFVRSPSSSDEELRSEA